MSDCMSREEAIQHLEEMKKGIFLWDMSELIDLCISALSENKGESKHGQWVRMSALPEDKDDRYKCSRCGNVVHHSNGVNLYHFNSWCGRCGSLNNSLIAGSDPKGEKGD